MRRVLAVLFLFMLHLPLLDLHIDEIKMVVFKEKKISE